MLHFQYVQPPQSNVFKIYPYYANYLVIKRVPTGYDNLSVDEKFNKIEHSGTTIRDENKNDRFDRMGRREGNESRFF